eukprot:scaffold13968_cov119-Isochrysis_galbana.AAC.7
MAWLAVVVWGRVQAAGGHAKTARQTRTTRGGGWKVCRGRALCMNICIVSTITTTIALRFGD